MIISWRIDSNMRKDERHILPCVIIFMAEIDRVRMKLIYISV